MKEKIIHKELSYRLTGLCFEVHNEFGRFCKERQYANEFEKLLRRESISYEREINTRKVNANSPQGNILDFLIDGKIILEFKAKKMVTKEDYYQIKRYLDATGLELGMIINFRNVYLKPKRILNAQSKYIS